MNLPNYEKDTIVNLMSSIAKSFERNSLYRPLDLLPIHTLKQTKNIVLIIIDGLGYQFLMEHGKGSFLYDHLVGPMTSVFPTTTAAAITSFATGVAPQQHAFTAWFMWFKELGTVCASLPFAPRLGGMLFEKQKIKIKKLLGANGFSDQLGTSTYLVMGKNIIHSAFNKTLFSKANRLPYSSLTGFFSQIKKAVISHPHKKFVHAYWPTFDTLAHKCGVNSDVVKKHFEDIDKKMKKFAKNIIDTNTMLIITSDHGLLDTTEDRTIRLKNHPHLQECLILPFCGEPRVNYCYVKPGRTEEFERYVHEHLGKYVDIYKSKELIEQNYFGLHQPHPTLPDRIGDYTLIAKENYIFVDQLLGEVKHQLIGVHGGLSTQELFTPLILI